jgi:hypothetical protein
MARIPVPAVMAFYDDPHDLLTVCHKAVHDERFRGVDAYSPYPVHGIEEALRIKRSFVSTVARAGLISGMFLGFILQAWAMAADWPINIGGKPFVSWPAYVPVSFETGILFAGWANLLTMFAACGLYPRPKTIVLSRRITNDRFVVVIPVRDKEEESRAINFLNINKALKIKIIDGIDKEKHRVIFRAAPIMEGSAT